MSLKKINNKLTAYFASMAICLAVCMSLCVSYASAADTLIAVVSSSSIKPYEEAREAYYDELREKDIIFQAREFTLGDSQKNENIISEIRDFNPHIIHTIGTDATKLLKENINDTPIVFSMVLNPVAGGLIKNMTSSGNNLTGSSMDLSAGIQFAYMLELEPETKKIGVIYSIKETAAVVESAKKSAESMGLELIAEAVQGPQDVPRAINTLKRKVDFFWSVADGNVFTRETVREMLLVSLRNKLPLMGLSPAFVKAGALFSISVYPEKIGRLAADSSAFILKGAEPSNIPISVPNTGKITINKNTLRLLGLKPAKSTLKKANIIEP